MGYLYSDKGIVALNNKDDCNKVRAVLRIIEEIRNNIVRYNNTESKRANHILTKLELAESYIINNSNYMDGATLLNNMLGVLENFTISTTSCIDNREITIMHGIQTRLIRNQHVFVNSPKVISYIILGHKNFVWYYTNIVYNIHNMINRDFPDIKTKKQYKSVYNSLNITTNTTSEVNLYFIEKIGMGISKVLDNTLDIEYERALESKKPHDIYEKLKHLSNVEAIIISFLNRDDKKQNLKMFLDSNGISIGAFQNARNGMKQFEQFRNTLEQLNTELNNKRSQNYAKLVSMMRQFASDINDGMDYINYCLKYKKSLKDIEELFNATKQDLDASEVRLIRTWISKNKSKEKQYNKKEIMDTKYMDSQGNLLYDNKMKEDVFNFIDRYNLPKSIVLFNNLIKIYKNTGKLELVA